MWPWQSPTSAATARTISSWLANLSTASRFNMRSRAGPSSKIATTASWPPARSEAGPVTPVWQNRTGDGIQDILVTNCQSNSLPLVPAVGGGFFNDAAPRLFPVGAAPRESFVGKFGGSGLGLVTVNAGSNDVTF